MDLNSKYEPLHQAIPQRWSPSITSSYPLDFGHHLIGFKKTLETFPQEPRLASTLTGPCGVPAYAKRDHIMQGLRAFVAAHTRLQIRDY